MKNLCFFIPVDETHALVDSATSANHQATPNDNVPSKGSGKKQKNETDKGMSTGHFMFFAIISTIQPYSYTVIQPYNPYRGLTMPLFCLYSTENSGVKLKELLSGLSSMTLSEAEAVSVMSLLQEKSPSALDTWYKVRNYLGIHLN